MNFKTFSVGTTNVFPMANSSGPGALFTEYNIRSRESIATPLAVNYFIGPSYTHGPADFALDVQRDAAGTRISSSTLSISEGRALINGHYVETLAPMFVDILEANADAQKNKLDPLKGKLVVGLRAMYSTEATMAGSILPEKDNDYYEGLQVVILPESQFKLPTDVPNEPDKVTAHIKLGTFNFMNGTINGIGQNVPNKYQVLNAERIANVDALISEGYIGKNGLDPSKLYTFAGKGTDPATGKDTWCDSTDSLMVWDRTPKLVADKPAAVQALFQVDASGKVSLVVPHKQVDGVKKTDGTPQYYQERYIELPVASYGDETSGTVDRKYTKHIKDLHTKIDNFYHMAKGKQVGYLDMLNSPEELPPLNPAWNVGDYILVNEDLTQDTPSDSAKAPATIYVVLPGQVNSISYVSKTTNSEAIPSACKGVCIATDVVDNVPAQSGSDEMNKIFGIPNAAYRGVVNEDYFVAIRMPDEKTTERYYYKVATASDNQYSIPVMLTGAIPLAQETVVGGFLNVPDTAVDGGYVYRDENGYLRLLDYGLLRSGVLAYQLGEDYETPQGEDISSIQAYLDEYVNYRVAFKSLSSIAQSTDDPYVINVTINLPEMDDESEEATLMIRGIDSRFNTSVYLHLKGNANNKLTINIMDCEKLRIDSNIEGSPKVRLYRSNLYYDAAVIDTLNKIEDLSLWYERYSASDPNLLVDNMTVIETEAPIISEEIDIWSEEVPNDNHFTYALKSITFAKDGTIIGCEMYIRNDTSANIEEHKYIIVSPFTLPEGYGLRYPATRLTRQLKITGSFVSCYPVTTPPGYKISSTQFSALTQTVDEYTTKPKLTGNISLLCDVSFIDDVVGIDPGTSIDGWESNSFHIFSGGVVG